MQEHMIDPKADRAMAIASTGANIPTLEHALSIFAYHVACIANDKGPRIGLHFYGNVSAFYRVAPSAEHVWDQFYVLASREDAHGACIGNRSAAREHYTALCAEVLREIACGTYKGE